MLFIFFILFFLIFVVGYCQATQRYMMPHKVLPIHTNPSALLRNMSYEGVHLEKVQQIGDLIKWRQTINGIPVYGSVITTHNHRNGEFWLKLYTYQFLIETYSYIFVASCSLCGSIGLETHFHAAWVLKRHNTHS